MQTDPSWLSRKVRDWMILTAAAALLIQAALLFIASGAEMRATADFRALYAAGALVRTGHAALLYNYDAEAAVQNAMVGPRTAALPFLYPPFAALLFVPLAALAYTKAFAVFACLNLAFAGVCAWLLVLASPLPIRAFPLGLAFTFGFTPVGFAIMQGQVSLLLLLAFCGCQLAWSRGRPGLAGLCLAGALLKFQIALPVALLCILWRQWRVAAGFAIGAGGLLAVSAAVVGIKGSVDYCTAVAGIGRAVSAGADEAHYGIFPARMPNLHGLACLLLGSGWIAVVATAILSAGLLAWAATRRPSVPLALVVALLVSYHLQPHDLTLLLLPLAASVRRLVDGRPAWAPIAVTLALLTPPIYLLLEGAARMPLMVAPVLLLLCCVDPAPRAGAPLTASAPARP